MTASDKTRAGDETLLEMLDMRARGHTTSEISAHFGVKRSTVLMRFNRVDHEEMPCLCSKPENRDGGMPRYWWRR